MKAINSECWVPSSHDSRLNPGSRYPVTDSSPGVLFVTYWVLTSYVLQAARTQPVIVDWVVFASVCLIVFSLLCLPLSSRLPVLSFLALVACSFCSCPAAFPLGHKSTYLLGNSCFIGLLGIQMVVEKQLKSIERLRSIGKVTNEWNPQLICLQEPQTNLLQKATK